MIDKALTVGVLEFLSRIGESVEEETLLNHVALHAAEPPSTEYIRKQLDLMRDQTFVTDSRGLLREKRWKITDAGKAALWELRP